VKTKSEDKLLVEKETRIILSNAKRGIEVSKIIVSLDNTLPLFGEYFLVSWSTSVVIFNPH